MVRLGFVKKINERMNFKEWCKFIRPGRYTVVAIFPPEKFQSFAVVFEDEEKKVDVRLSLGADKFKKALHALGLRLEKRDLPSFSFVVNEDFTYGIDLNVEEIDYVLAWTGRYWKRQKINEDLAVEF